MLRLLSREVSQDGWAKEDGEDEEGKNEECDRSNESNGDRESRENSTEKK